MRVVHAALLVAVMTAAGIIQAQSVQSDARAVQLTGHAFDRETGAFLYTEHHRIEMQGDRAVTHRIDYRDGGDLVFATKVLDYRAHAYAPDFRTTDLRDGYFEGGEHTAHGYRLYHQQGDKTESTTISTGGDLVADSGFDRYVKAYLADWLREEVGSMRMAVAGRLADYRVGVKLVERTQLFGREAAVFRVQPSTLLSVFVDPVFITYDTRTGQLLRYTGTTNICTRSGKRYDARIDFDPDEKSPRNPGNVIQAQ